MAAPKKPTKLPELRLRIQVHGRHPRFYRKQVQKPARPLPTGSRVFVRDKEGKAIGTGFYNSRSQVALRIFDRGFEPAGEGRIMELLQEAIDYRERRLRLQDESEAYRLVHAEGDGLPGLILDKLGDHLVAQLALKGLEAHMEEIGEALLRRYPGSKLVLHIDKEMAELEGLTLRSTRSDAEAWLREDDLLYRFHPGQGHKTGFFCDQRENRKRLGKLAKGRRVLDLCCNSGGFAMHAARGGAKKVEAYDLDEKAVALARDNARRNGLTMSVAQADAFELLRERKTGSCDVLILDPPKWVHGKDDWDSGLRRYLDLNRLGFKLLQKGGLLVTCSCSGQVSEDRFLSVLRDAAGRAGRDARILHLGGAGPDHPVALECPETRYLKVVFLEIR